METVVSSRRPRRHPRALALAALAGLGNASGLAAWQGRSGRRYVVTRHAICDDFLAMWSHAIFIAIRSGTSETEPLILGVRANASAPDLGLGAWIAIMRMSGATSLDVHLGVKEDALRAQAVADLAP